ARDFSRHKAAEEAHARLAAVVAASAEAIVGADADGAIASWNPGAQRLYGYHQTEVLGRPIADLVESAQRTRWGTAPGRVREGDDAVRLTTRLTHRGGRVVESAVELSPVRDAGGHIVGLSMTGRRTRPEEAAGPWSRLAELARVCATLDPGPRLEALL